MNLNHHSIELGATVNCHVTGKPFITAREGCSLNYAWDSEGHIISNEGVDISERRELQDRSKPFSCYLSCDGLHVTGWKGNILGNVAWDSVSRTGWHGSSITHVRIIDVHGNKWHGKGSGRGMCITLRASK